MKRREILNDLRTKSSSELVEFLGQKREKLIELKFSLGFNKLKNTQAVQAAKIEIARAETVLRDKVSAELSVEKK